MFEQISLLDKQILYFIQSFHQPLLTLLMQLITLIGNPAFWFVICVYLYWKGDEKQSLILMNIITFSALISEVLKTIVQRARPLESEFNVIKDFTYKLFEKTHPYNFSFPSGHATLITAIATYLDSLKRKPIITFTLLCIVLAVGFSRIYLGMHFFTDVIFGIFLGMLIGKFSYTIIEKIEEKDITIKSTKIILLAAVAFLCAIILLIIGEFSLGFVLWGFYVGLFLLKFLNINSIGGEKKKIFIGFFGIAVLLFLLINIEGFLIEMILFFIIGFWSSFIVPLTAVFLK